MKKYQPRYQMRREPRRGQAALLMTLLITLICGAIGLVVDIGWGYFKKQSAQAAAESAALAAASWARATNSSLCGSGNLVCSSSPCASVASGSELYVGCQYAAQNGYTDGSGNQHVTISANTGSPTSTTGVANSAIWVTATVSEAEPQTFSRLLGSPSWLTASAQATASVPYGKSKYCLYALGTSGTVFTVTGNATFSATCSIYSNANAQVQGSGQVSLSGGAQLVAHGTASGTISPAPLQNQTAVSDPYAALQLASYTPTATACKPNPTGGTIGPGTYCSTINTSGADLTLTTGTYIFQNGINWSGGTLTGNNVFIYVSGGSVTQTGGTLKLTAETSGTYAGIAFYQDVNDTNGMNFSGGGSLQVTGVMYAPGSAVTFGGGSSFTASSSSPMTFAAKTFTLTGGGSIASSATSGLTGGAPGLVQ